MSVPRSLLPRLTRSTAVAQYGTALAAMVVAGALLIALQFVSMRRDHMADLRAQAEVLALSGAAPLLFGDARAANEALAALRALPDVQAAAFFDTRGEPLARYARDAAATAVRAGGDANEHVGFAHVELSQPVTLDGTVVGRVDIRAGLGRLYQRLLSFAGLFVLAAAGALAISHPLVRRLQREVRHAGQQLQRLAHHDLVTGLFNRNAFGTQLEDRLRAGAAPAALLLIDIDNFKVVNDTLGHDRGDELLRTIAARLVAPLPEHDVVFRVGGDEFAVVFEDLREEADTERRAQRVLDVLQAPISLGGYEIHVTASGGLALFPHDAGDLQTLTSHADTAMYHAKREGKNGCRRFRPEMNQLATRRLRLQNDLRRALARDELTLHYQPQVRMGDGRIVGVEALARWAHPELGNITPDEFISIAEDAGLIVPLGRWVVRTACRQLAQWRDAGLDGLRVAVNVSARQARDTRLPAFIDEVLAETGVPAKRLELEITESLLLDNAAGHVELLRTLRRRGVLLSIDDFGTGYSSMAYLQHLPVDQLKLDMSFVRRVPGDGDPIVVAIVAMAHALGMAVVAEGVETAEQRQFLDEVGCEMAQGYLFARPMPADDVEALIRRHGGVLEPPG